MLVSFHEEQLLYDIVWQREKTKNNKSHEVRGNPYQRKQDRGEPIRNGRDDCSHEEYRFCRL